jgi:hypothetical protein
MRCVEPIVLPPLSGPALRAIARARVRIEHAMLSIDIVSETVWRVRAADGAELSYFPHEDRWRRDGKWGRGVLTLIAELQEQPWMIVTP